MLKLLKLILEIPLHIKYFVLQQYIKQCRKRHAIAFIEWRLHFSSARKGNSDSTQMENEDVQEIITDRCEYLAKEFKSITKHFQMLPDTVRKGALIPIKSLKYYGLDNK